MAARRFVSGFTLIEALVSIVILGIIAGMVAVFIRAPVDAYLDTASRAALTESADGAIKRMRRDIQAALPNSFRPPANGDTACFEFLPMVASGRYRTAADSGNDANDNVLDFTIADTGFDALAHLGLNLVGNTHEVVIYNLGIPGANAYATPRENRAAIAAVAIPAAGGAAATITLAGAGLRFPFESPGRRFQVIENQAVRYSCVGGSVWRSRAAIANAAMATCPAAGGDELVRNVNCAGSFFTYVPANATREGMVEILLTLTSPAPQSETIRLYDRVSVNNAP